MLYMIIMGAIILAPVLAVVIFRSQGAVTFMSVSLGYVLSRLATDDIKDVLTGFFSISPSVISDWVKLIVLLLPVVLALIFTIGSVKGSKRFFNILPALATGGLLALFAVRILPFELQDQLVQTIIWQKLSSAETPILLAGTFFSLLYFSILSRARRAIEADKKK